MILQPAVYHRSFRCLFYHPFRPLYHRSQIGRFLLMLHSLSLRVFATILSYKKSCYTQKPEVVPPSSTLASAKEMSEGYPICVKQFAVFFLSVYIVWHSFCGIITANVAEGCIVKIREISNRLIRDSEIRKLHTAQKLRNFMACFH